MKKSIRYRLTLAFIGFAVFPLLLVGALLAWQSFANMQQEAVRLQQEVARSISVEASSFINSLENDLRMVVDINDIHMLTHPQQLDLLGALQAHQKAFVELTLLDGDGRERVRLSRLKTITSDDLCDRSKKDEFLITEKEAKTYYSPVWFDATTGEPFITIALPLKDLQKGQVDGVLVADVFLKKIWNLIAGLRTNPGEDIYIVDAQGRVIVHRNPSVVLRDTHFTLPEKAGFYSGLNSSSVVMAMDRVRFGDQVFAIVAEREANQALSLAIRTVWIVISLLLVVFVVAGGVGILTVRRIVHPIQELAKVARDIQAGELSKKASVSSDDEIGELATAFNNMTYQLSQTMESLQAEVAERKRAEKKLRRTVTDLERSNVELQQFAYVASHDLQEPLRMVSSYMQLLERRYKGKLDADADDFIEFAVDGAKRMQALINDLLTFSRVGTRGEPFKMTDCEDVLEQVLANLEVAISESGAVVTHDLLPTVAADASQLTQLFQNLIGNAIKFRGDESPRVHISTTKGTGIRDQRSEIRDRESESTNYELQTTNYEAWAFSVADNGIGIDPEFFDRIFVIFQRLHGRDEYSGTGIGLAVCKKIVERHGGRMWVESEPGKGSTFYFTIPAKGAERQ